MREDLTTQFPLLMGPHRYPPAHWERLIMSLKTKGKSLLIEDQLWHLLLLFQANGNLCFSARAFIDKFFLKKIIQILNLEDLGPEIHTFSLQELA